MSREGALGIEPASWKPPPLAELEHVYFAGRNAGGPELECSCLLQEYVDWSDRGGTLALDDLGAPICPFDTLRAACEQAIAAGGVVRIVCDDSNGLAQRGELEDYHQAVLVLYHIRRGRGIFATTDGGIPCRSYDAVPQAA